MTEKYVEYARRRMVINMTYSRIHGEVIKLLVLRLSYLGAKPNLIVQNILAYLYKYIHTYIPYKEFRNENAIES